MDFLGVLGKIKSALFGEKTGEAPKSQKEAIAKMMEALELMETRVREFSTRSRKARAEAKEALKRNNEKLAKQYLSEWYYSNQMEEMYRGIYYNLNHQLDVIKKAKDMAKVAEAFSAAQEVLAQATKLISSEETLRKAVQLKVMGKQVDATMRTFAKQMGVPLDVETNQQIQQELELLQSEVEAEALSGLPTPVGEEEAVTTTPEVSDAEKEKEAKIDELLKKLKQEASKEEQTS